MNLSAHGSRTSFFPSPLDSTFAHFADAKRENASRLVSGMGRSNINHSLETAEILNPLMLNDIPFSHEWNATELPYSSTGPSYGVIDHARRALWSHRLRSTELSYSVIKHMESSISAFLAEETNLVGRLYGFHGVVKSKLDEFPGYSPSTELASFDDLMVALQTKGFNESAARLAYLHSSEDMEEGDAPLSLESVRGFVNFINDFQDLGREPLLGLAPSGDLSVEWRIADNKHLGVWPLDSGYVHFAFIGPSGKLGERAHLSGEGTIAKVISILREHGVDQWAKT